MYYFTFDRKKILENISIKIDNVEIEQVTSTKFLGVILQENLGWNDHITAIATKINKHIGVLRALQHKLPTSILFTLYNTLIYPYLQYCNIAWAPQQSNYIDKLFILQKKALRVVCKTQWDAHTTPLFKSLNTLKIQDVTKLQTGCFMYKAMNNQLPPLFADYFTLNCNIHNYFTRQSEKIHTFAIKTSVRKYSIKYFGSCLWNSLPTYIAAKPSIFSFKKAYKNHLMSAYCVV